MRKHLPLLVFLVIVAIYPVIFRDHFALGAAITVAGFAVGTVGFVLLLGLAHQLAIGQAAFYMVGGYGSAILTTRYGWGGASSALVSAALAVVLAYVLGRPLLKLRGFVLAIASLALQLLFIALAILMVDFTGGASGIPAVPRLSIGPWVVQSDLAYYFLSWAVVAVMVMVGLNIDRSKIGRALRAVAADEAGAAASGIDTVHYKLLIFVISAAMASLGGSIIVHYLRVIDPTVFGLQFSLDIITAVIVGGLHSVWGGVLGAGAIIAVREALRLAEQPAWEVIVMGVLTVIVLLCFRSGLVGAISRLFGRKGFQAAPAIGGSAAAVELFPFRSAPPSSEGAVLSVSRVSRSFGNLRAVSDVSFDVKQNQIIALIGPNGAGKTTMLDMISGHRALNAGQVSFCDKDFTTLMPDQIARAGVARTFQAIRLFDNMTVLENVMCGAHIFARSNTISLCLGTQQARADDVKMAQIAREALRFVGLESASESMPGELPFGHQRMMELARALALGPRLLLLDEPASGLNDTETEQLANLLLRIRSSGVTLLLVEHDIRLVMGLADKVVVMDHGVKIADGSPTAVRNDPQVITAYLGLAA